MKYDCRAINNGMTCPNLIPFGDKPMKLLIKTYTCSELNCILWAEMINYNTPNVKVLRVKPRFSCSKMVELRKKGEAELVELAIDGKNHKYWDE